MNIKKNLGILIALFVSLWFFGPLFSFDTSNKEGLFVSEKLNSNDGDSENLNTNSISIREILGDSYVADVDYLVMPSSGFVAVVNNNSKIIGASKLLDRGVSRNLSIILTESLKRGEYYGVSIYQDDGNKIFSEKDDDIYLYGEHNIAFVGGFLAK